MLVRGPKPAYVELIAAGTDESNPWLDRVRSARGPISWAIAVDDIEVARTSLVDAGFTPSPVVDGSRRTPEGGVVEWRLCDVAEGPYDGTLPFLIQWTTPMEPGSPDGPIVEHVSLTPSDADRLADLMLAVGFAPSRHWPRRVFHDAVSPVGITLNPVGEAEDLGEGSWSVSWEGSDEPPVTVTLRVPHGEQALHTLDGVAVTTFPDPRRFAGAGLLPAVDEAFVRLRGDLADWPNPHPGGAAPAEHEYSRVSDPERYRLLAVRADAWVEAVTAAGLGVAEQVDPVSVSWVDEQHLEPGRTTVLRGAGGTQPVVVGYFSDETFVQIGVGQPVEVLDRQPDCGCDACDTGSVDLLETVDNAFILALSGGVYVVRGRGSSVVRRSLDGWSSNDVDHDQGARWLAEAADGRRTDGVVSGDPWL